VQLFVNQCSDGGAHSAAPHRHFATAVSCKISFSSHHIIILSVKRLVAHLVSTHVEHCTHLVSTHAEHCTHLVSTHAEHCTHLVQLTLNSAHTLYQLTLNIAHTLYQLTLNIAHTLYQLTLNIAHTLYQLTLNIAHTLYQLTLNIANPASPQYAVRPLPIPVLLSSLYIIPLRARRFGVRIPVGAIFSAPVQTGLGAHSALVQWAAGLSWG
jgi:hypothetical protein